MSESSEELIEKPVEKTVSVKQVLEAALFMSPKPIHFNDLFRLGNGNILEFRKSLNELMNDLDERDSALELVETGSGFQMKVRHELLDKVNFLASSPEMSSSVTKTLAFIAYKQPVKQSLIVKYRSNVAYDDIKILLEQGFIAREPFEKTFILRTTKKFVDYFGENPVTLVKHSQNPAPEAKNTENSKEQQEIPTLKKDSFIGIEQEFQL